MLSFDKGKTNGSTDNGKHLRECVFMGECLGSQQQYENCSLRVLTYFTEKRPWKNFSEAVSSPISLADMGVLYKHKGLYLAM